MSAPHAGDRENDPAALDPVEVLVARDEIRRLAHLYADAVDRRDLDLLADLYAPDADFGAHGRGPDACRRFFDEALAGIGVAVLLVANHLVDVDDAEHAHGQVWTLAHVDDHREGFIEQLIRYDDRYVRVGGRWLFRSRRHRLWYGVPRPESPFDQSPANWPERQVGVGTLPYGDPAWQAYWRRHRGS
ncbi:MAG: nuclear transport factor 2 family protein [Actinomyces sp.]|nr:MAG: nuclear transport factor 2 family protein [Actinomyces sp.]